MPFTCAPPLRSVGIGAGVGGKISHLSAASAGRTARTRVGASKNGRMSFSLWASNYLSISGRSTPISTAAIVTKCAVEARNEGFHGDSAALPDALINLAIKDAIAREESSCRKMFSVDRLVSFEIQSLQQMRCVFFHS